ncbi:MAG: monovalent cation/H+ antiporter subunit D family protein [Verrucomicrobiota bacterium]
MVEQLPAIVVLTPMVAALLVTLLGLRRRAWCFPVVIVGLGATLAAATGLLVRVYRDGPVDYFMGGWEVPLGIGIQLRVDGLNALVLMTVAVVALIVGVYSFRREEDVKVPAKTVPFYTLFLLLVTGLCGITITADAFNLFVLLEVTSLTGYGLVAMGSSKRGKVAAFNYVIMGTIGASFILLGTGYLYIQTGTLNMEGIREVIEAQDLFGSTTIVVAFILMMVGVFIKMAFFPLYGWLPNAYSYCPSTTSCILAPLMTKVSIYIMIRFMLGIFGAEYVFQAHATAIVVWLAVLAVLAGSLLALAQVEIKKMLCYLIVAEVGYMVGGAWLANHWGMVGALYHIVSDAIMTLCLFLGASILWSRLKARRIDDLSGAFRKMPWTMSAFVLGGLAMIGVPPTSGFFSKWYLIRGGMEAGRWEYVVVLLVSSLVNAILFFRIIEIAYFGKEPAESHGGAHGEGDVEERVAAPRVRLVALWAAAILVVLVGVFNGELVSFIEKGLEGIPIIGNVGGGN